LFGELPALFKNEDELRLLWSQPETRRKLLEALSDKGFGETELDAIKKLIDADKRDLYDVRAYIAFALARCGARTRWHSEDPGYVRWISEVPV
jgi:type I restriction enzyme R subunit